MSVLLVQRRLAGLGVHMLTEFLPSPNKWEQLLCTGQGECSEPPAWTQPKQRGPGAVLLPPTSLTCRGGYSPRPPPQSVPPHPLSSPDPSFLAGQSCPL